MPKDARTGAFLKACSLDGQMVDRKHRQPAYLTNFFPQQTSRPVADQLNDFTDCTIMRAHSSMPSVLFTHR